MSDIDFLLSRFSCSSLIDPAPNKQQLYQILSAAMCAPDHGRLRPWRFIVISEQYRAEWIEAVKKAMTNPQYNYPESYMPKVIHNFSSAPLMLALGMLKKTEKTSVSVDEQLMSASAAVMNVLNGLHALGFGGKWITGPIANQEIVAQLGLQDPYRMMGFMFIGTPGPSEVAPPRVSVDGYVADWQGSPVQFKADLV